MKSRIVVLLILCLTLYRISISCINKQLISLASDLVKSESLNLIHPPTTTTTNLSRLLFGILGSEKAWRHRKAYTESWTNDLRGLLINKHDLRASRMVLREFEHQGQEVRWVAMGDDDTIFYVDNIVEEVLGQLDGSHQIFVPWQSEFIMFSFEEAFGGAGIVMSYPVAKALAALRIWMLCILVFF